MQILNFIQIMPLFFRDVLHEDSFTRAMATKWRMGNLAESVYTCCRLLARYLYLLNQPDMSTAISEETATTIADHHRLFGMVIQSINKYKMYQMSPCRIFSCGKKLKVDQMCTLVSTLSLSQMSWAIPKTMITKLLKQDTSPTSKEVSAYLRSTLYPTPIIPFY